MRSLALGCALVFSSSCAYLRSSRDVLEQAVLVDERRSCALVFLPGLGDDPQRFREHGFDAAVSQSDAPCDVVALDSHFGYYRDGVLVDRVSHDVLAPLRDRYRQVWLVGVSLGGYGAALIAQAHPELVDGVVLISPFLGVERQLRPFVERVKAAGGLAEYQGPFASRTNPRRHFMEVEPLWAWLAERARGAEGPRLIIAWGSADGFSWKHRLVGAGLSSEDAVQLDGGHTWDTFAALWREVAASCPWKS